METFDSGAFPVQVLRFSKVPLAQQLSLLVAEDELHVGLHEEVGAMSQMVR